MNDHQAAIARDPFSDLAGKLAAKLADLVRSLVAMTITHAAGTRTALADQVDALVNTGSGTAQLVWREGTTDVVAFDLQDPAFGAASTGTITLQGVPLSATAGAQGDVDNFEVNDQNGALVFAGSITATSGGGDIEVDNISVNPDQGCEQTSFTYSAPS